jgi:hypothetical protein
MAQYWYWLSADRGLIRTFGETRMGVCPEVWSNGGWTRGSPYVMDAVTGMGEDLYSCGEWASEIGQEEAAAYASANGIRL